MDNSNEAEIVLRNSTPDRDVETLFENNFWDNPNPNEELFPIHVECTLQTDVSRAHGQDFIEAERLEIDDLRKSKV